MKFWVNESTSESIEGVAFSYNDRSKVLIILDKENQNKGQTCVTVTANTCAVLGMTSVL